MGSWGFTALENDAAQDWLEKLFEGGWVVDYVDATLQQDVREHGDEIRAAAHLLHTLVKADLWPTDSRTRFVGHAVFRLEEMLTRCEFTNFTFIAEIRHQIKLLRSCVKPMVGTTGHSAPRPIDP